MAQTNFTPIQLYYSATGSATPSAGNLIAGELAINTTDEKLYFKNSSGVVKVIADTAFVATTVPIGCEMFWPTETPPAGWLMEDGSSLARVGIYSGLFAVIGTTYGAADANHFNLPDSRGMFVRSWANGSSNDPDRASRTAVTTTGATMSAGDHVGTTQTDDFEAHTHPIDWNTQNTNVGGGGLPTAIGATSQVTGSRGGNETRPLNTARMMIIKY